MEILNKAKHLISKPISISKVVLTVLNLLLVTPILYMETFYIIRLVTLTISSRLFVFFVLLTLPAIFSLRYFWEYNIKTIKFFKQTTFTFFLVVTNIGGLFVGYLGIFYGLLIAGIFAIIMPLLFYALFYLDTKKEDRGKSFKDEARIILRHLFEPIPYRAKFFIPVLAVILITGGSYIIYHNFSLTELKRNLINWQIDKEQNYLDLKEKIGLVKKYPLPLEKTISSVDLVLNNGEKKWVFSHDSQSYADALSYTSYKLLEKIFDSGDSLYYFEEKQLYKYEKKLKKISKIELPVGEFKEVFFILLNKSKVIISSYGDNLSYLFDLQTEQFSELTSLNKINKKIFAVPGLVSALSDTQFVLRWVYMEGGGEIDLFNVTTKETKFLTQSGYWGSKNVYIAFVDGKLITADRFMTSASDNSYPEFVRYLDFYAIDPLSGEKTILIPEGSLPSDINDVYYDKDKEQIVFRGSRDDNFYYYLWDTGQKKIISWDGKISPEEYKNYISPYDQFMKANKEYVEISSKTIKIDSLKVIIFGTNNLSDNLYIAAKDKEGTDLQILLVSELIKQAKLNANAVEYFFSDPDPKSKSIRPKLINDRFISFRLYFKTPKKTDYLLGFIDIKQGKIYLENNFLTK